MADEILADQASREPAFDLGQLIQSAQRLGIELDQDQALQWLTAMAEAQASQEIAVDQAQGIFAHKVVMLDFSPAELARFRQIGAVVGFNDRPGSVETALALSGSSAQSLIQTYPGDADFFERVNILAVTQQEAEQTLAELMREKALLTARGPFYQLIEVKFGAFPCDVRRGERTYKAGAPAAWTADEIERGQIEAFRPDGTPFIFTWEQASRAPGWCKLDWVVADPQRGGVANASNMLDVTWEAPDGTITPLDGFLDPYFQEVYLEAEAIPIFSKLARQVSEDALERYVQQLEHEVKKFLMAGSLNYGKAAKRMYNIFRFTRRYQAAAFLRELFDEPAAMLYQVWSLIRTIDDCVKPNGAIGIEQLLAQADELILAVIKAMEGDQEAEVVRRLLRLRDALTHQTARQGLTVEAEAARDEVINVVNNFFYDKLSSVPEIKDYIDCVQVYEGCS